MRSPPSLPRGVAFDLRPQPLEHRGIVPSRSFQKTLPVKPSRSTTSTSAPSSSQRLGELPAKRRSLSARSLCASCVAWLPFAASSPIESSPTSGSAIARISSAKIAPIVANCTRCSGRDSGVCAGVDQHRRAFRGQDDDRDRRTHHASQAPDLEQRCGEHGARVPGRDRRRRIAYSTDRQAATSELSGFAHTASAGFSCISISCVVSTNSGSPHLDAEPKSTGWTVSDGHLLRRLLPLPRAHGHRRARRPATRMGCMR